MQVSKTLTILALLGLIGVACGKGGGEMSTMGGMTGGMGGMSSMMDTGKKEAMMACRENLDASLSDEEQKNAMRECLKAAFQAAGGADVLSANSEVEDLMDEDKLDQIQQAGAAVDLDTICESRGDPHQMDTCKRAMLQALKKRITKACMMMMMEDGKESTSVEPRRLKGGMDGGDQGGMDDMESQMRGEIRDKLGNCSCHGGAAGEMLQAMKDKITQNDDGDSGKNTIRDHETEEAGNTAVICDQLMNRSVSDTIKNGIKDAVKGGQVCSISKQKDMNVECAVEKLKEVGKCSNEEKTECLAAAADKLESIGKGGNKESLKEVAAVRLAAEAKKAGCGCDMVDAPCDAAKAAYAGIQGYADADKEAMYPLDAVAKLVRAKCEGKATKVVESETDLKVVSKDADCSAKESKLAAVAGHLMAQGCGGPKMTKPRKQGRTSEGKCQTTEVFDCTGTDLDAVAGSVTSTFGQGRRLSDDTSFEEISAGKDSEEVAVDADDMMGGNGTMPGNAMAACSHSGESVFCSELPNRDGEGCDYYAKMGWDCTACSSCPEGWINDAGDDTMKTTPMPGGGDGTMPDWDASWRNCPAWAAYATTACPSGPTMCTRNATKAEETAFCTEFLYTPACMVDPNAMVWLQACYAYSNEWEDWNATFAACPEWGAWSKRCMAIGNCDNPDYQTIQTLCSEYNNDATCMARSEAMHHLGPKCAGCGLHTFECGDYQFCNSDEATYGYMRGHCSSCDGVTCPVDAGSDRAPCCSGGTTQMPGAKCGTLAGDKVAQLKSKGWEPVPCA